MNQREAFERWASKPPMEFYLDRHDDTSAWPGNYKDYHVESAWQAWQAAIAAQWQHANSAPYDEQVWIRFVFPCGTKGQGYGIRVSDNDWFFDVSEDGDMISRSKSLKEGLTCAYVTHWMPLPPAP